MSLVVNRAGCKYVTLFVCLLLTLALALGAGSANAETFSGKLSSKEWSCGKCDVEKSLTFIEAYVNGEEYGDICVGPIQYYNKSFHTPYGWKCSFDISWWEFSSLEASEGVYNSGSNTYRYYGVAS